MTTTLPTGASARTPSTSPAPAPTVHLGGVDIDCLTQEQVVDHVFDRLDDDEGGQLFTANVDHLRQVQAGGPLASLYRSADLAVADGMPLVWASRLLGTPLPERVTGADLLWSICEAAAERDSTVFLLGGTEGAAAKAAAVLVNRYPGLRVVGTSCPPYGFEEDARSLDAVLTDVAAHRPDVVFTGLGAPKQEAVNAQLAARLPGTWFLGVGAAFDMASGEVRRAPRLVQGSGLEWLYRLVQEPRRLFRRYLIEGVPTVARLLGQSALRRRQLRSSPVAG